LQLVVFNTESKHSIIAFSDWCKDSSEKVMMYKYCENGAHDIKLG
jgi:hypothetical protein